MAGSNNNVQKTFRFNFDFNKKDVKKQLKDISGDVADFIKNIGEASDKVTIFKDLVSYLSNVDKALSDFKSKNKDVFQQIFGSLDSDLTKHIEGLFGLDSVKITLFNDLRKQIDDAAKSGNKLEKLKKIAQSINDLYASTGSSKRINMDMFNPRATSTQDKLDALKGSLDDIMYSFGKVQDLLRNGFSVGGTGSGGVIGSGGDIINVDAIKQQISDLETQVQRYRDLINEFNDIGRAKTSLVDGNLDGDFVADYTVESVQTLIKTYRQARDEVEKLKKAGDTSSVSYFENLSKMSTAAIKLQDINDNMSGELEEELEGVQIKNGTLLGSFENIIGEISDFIDNSFDNIFKDIPNRIQNAISEAGSQMSLLQDKLKVQPGTGGIGTGGDAGKKDNSKNIRQEIELYQQLKSNVEKYYKLLEDRNKFDEGSDDYNRLDRELQGIVEDVRAIKQLDGRKAGDLTDIFGDIEYEGVEFENTIKNLCALLEIHVPDAAQRAESTLSSFLSMADEFEVRARDSMDDVAIGIDIEKLERGKQELEELSKQGLISAEDFNKATIAFHNAMEELNTRKSINAAHIEYLENNQGGGGYYDYDYYLEYQEEKERANKLEEELKRKFDNQIIDKADYVEILSTKLEKLFDNVNSMSGTIEYKVLINGKEIDIKKGHDKGISVQEDIEAYLGSLNKNTIVSAHNHPGLASSDFNAVDVKSIMDDVYGGIAKVGMIVSEHDISTLNLAGVDIVDAFKALKKIEKLDLSHISSDQINEIFTSINPNYQNIAQKWDKSQFKDLAGFIFDIGMSAENAIDPLTKFQNILKITTGGKIDLSKYKDLFDTFNAENAGNIFNQIMEQEGLALQVEDLNIDSLDDFVNKINQQKEAFMNLRKEADITYSEIRNNVQSYIDYMNMPKDERLAAQDPMDGFIKKYFGRHERDQFDSWLYELENGEATVNQITNRIAGYFDRIDPSEYLKDDFTKISSVHIDDNIEKAKIALQDFFAMTKEIQDKSLTLYGAEDNVEIGKYIERLESTREVLRALGDQGLITAEDLNKVDNEFKYAKDKLDARIVHYDGYGSGDYYDSYEDEYIQERARVEALESENESLKQERKYADDRAIEDFDRVVSDIKDTGVIGMSSDEITRYLDQLSSLYNQIRAIHGEFGLSDELMAAKDASFTEASAILAEARQKEETYKELLRLNDKATIIHEESELGDIVQQRKELTVMAEACGWFDEETLKTQKAITDEIEKRIGLQKAQSDTNLLDFNTNGAASEHKSNAEDTTLVGDKNINDETQQLERLKAILLEVEQAVQAKTQAFRTEGVVVDQVVQREIDSLKQLLLALGYIKSAMENIYGGFFGSDTSNLPALSDGNINTEMAELSHGGDYALNSTLLTTNNILDQILIAIGNNESISKFVNLLNDTITELKNVANGIVEHQKAQRTDYTDASSRIANNYGQLSSITGNTVNGLGTEFKIENMKALADNVIRVKGAVQDASGVWKGFVVDIDESNNAVVRAVDEQSAFAKSLNDTAKAVKAADSETNKKSNSAQENPFTKAKYNVEQSFDKYRKETEASIYITDEFKNKLSQLKQSIQTVDDQAGLDAFTANLESFKKEFNKVEAIGEEKTKRDLRSLTGIENSLKKELNFDINVSDDDLNDSQKIIKQHYNEIIQLIDEQRVAVKNGSELEISAIQEKIKALKAETNEYKIQNDYINTQSKSGKNFGATAITSEKGRYKKLSAYTQDTSEGFAKSDAFMTQFKSYEDSLNRLIDLRNKISNMDNITGDVASEFDRAKKECGTYARELEKLINTSMKLKNNSDKEEILDGDFDLNTLTGRKEALTDFVERMYGVSVAAEDFKDGFNKCVFAVENGDGTFTQMTATLDTTRHAIVSTAGDTQKATTAFGRFFDELKGKFKSIGTYLAASLGWQEIWQQIRKGVEYVREIDSALTELKKVTNETDAAYDQFLQDMSKTASVVGSTVADLTTMASEWARLGYSMEEAGKLAKSTAILLNVSEFNDATAASEALISTMQAFQYTADESQHVVDILNEVGNNYAVSSDGIATALQDSASALMEGGNNLEQATALVAAANRVVQDPSSVGSALRTISLRLRGTSVEILEEMGEETDGVVESTSKLQEKLKALTGVDIVGMNGAYKDTYTILKEIGSVWKDLDPMDQAAALELMAGKNRANTLSAILNNMKDLEGAYESALNAEGSALKENETYLDSIQGRIDLFTNEVQTFWMNTISSDMAKVVVDFGTSLIDLVDKIGLVPTALSAVLLYFTAIKKNNPVTIFKDLSASMQNYGHAISQIQAIQSLNVGSSAMPTDKFNAQNINAYAAAVSNLTAKQQAAALASAGLTQAQIQEALVKNDVDAANIKQAMSEANITTAKTQTTAATVAEAIAVSAEEKAKLSSVAVDWLAANSSKQLTLELIQEAVQHGIITPQVAAEVIAKYNLVGANNAASLSFKGLGASIKAMMVSNPVGWIIGIISAVVSLISWVSSLQKSNEELIQQADELKNAYKQESDMIQGNISTLQDLESEFARLSKGVDDYGNNISLATDDYTRYQKIVETIVGISPSLIQGYDAEGNAIANKNGLLQKSIDLMQEEQRLKAKEYLSDENIKTIIDGAKTSFTDDVMNVPTNLSYSGVKILEDGTIKTGFVNNIADYIEQAIGVQFNNQGIDKYIQENLDLVEKNIGTILNNAGQNFTDENGNTWQGLNPEQVESLETYLYSIIDATNKASDEIRSMLQLVPQTKTGYYDLDESTRKFLSQYANSFHITKDTTNDDIKDMQDEISQFTDFIIRNSGVESVIQVGFNLNSGKDADGKNLNISEYQKQVAEFKKQIQDSTYTDDQKNILLSMFGLNNDDVMENDIDEAIQHVENILKGKADQLSTEAQAYLDNLSITEALYIKANISTDLSGLSVDELKQKINETYEFDIADYTDAISSHSAVISEYQEAIQKLGKGSFTMDDFMALIKKYPDLAKGVDISSNAFYGLSRNLNKAIKSNTKNFIKDLIELRARLVAAGKSTGSIDQLIDAIENMPSDALDDIIQKYSTLADKIDKAKLSQDKLLASMEENPNEGYETRGEAMEYMKEAMKKGEIGSESNLWNVAEKYGFTYDSAKTINENADALAKYIAIREKWFAHDDDGDDSTDDGYSYKGTESFIKDVESAVANNAELQQYLTWDYDETTGTLNFDYNNEDWDTIVSILSKTKELAGLTSDEFSDMMIQIGQYFGIEWGNYDDVLDHLNGIATGTSDAKTKVEEYGEAMQDYFGENSDVDLTTRPMVKFDQTNFKEWERFYKEIINNPDGHSEADVKNAQEQVAAIARGDSYATVYSSTFSNEDGTKSVVVTPILPDGKVLSPEQLEEYANKLLAGEELEPGINIKLAEFDGSNSTQKANEYAQALHEAQAEYDTLRDPLNINTIIDEQGIEGLSKIPEVQKAITENSNGVTIVDKDAFQEVLEIAGYAEEDIDRLLTKVQELNNATSNISIISENDDPLGLNNTELTIDSLKSSLQNLGVDFTEVWGSLLDPSTWFNGTELTINVQDLVTTLKAKGWDDEQIKSYCQQLSDEVDLEGFNIHVEGIENIDEVISKSDEVPEEEKINVEITGTALTDAQAINNELNKMEDKTVNVTINETTVKTTKDKTKFNLFDPSTWVDGTANVQGNAYAGGSWGAPRTETALTGELGPEILVRNGRWTTVGENGAEFTQVKKGDIIFNHKQTESLLKNGYVTSRGKAYASGTAFAEGGGTFARYDFSGSGGYQKFDVNDSVVDSFGDISDAASDAADAAEEFAETIDWIEIRMEELDEALSKASAELENLSTYTAKNAKIEEMISTNQSKYANAKSGADYYENYANKYWNQIPEQFRDAAKNGAIAITDFVGDVNEATVEAINNYRTYAQKAADLYQQAEETITEICNLAIQKIDNIQAYGDAITNIEGLQTDKLQSRVDYQETSGYVPSAIYYGTNGGNADNSTGMFENSYKKIEYWTPVLEDMRKAFDEAVQKGEIEVGSTEWYDQIAKIYEVDAAIFEAKTEIEEFQNAINDIYWENFDNLINQFESLEDEAQNLIDLMSHDDMVVEPQKQTYQNGTVEFWTEDDVKWTKEGIASLGLYAQKMEIAEKKAVEYGKEMDKLSSNHDQLIADGIYSESEYQEKLKELTDAQYENIEAYYDAQDAIVSLNQERIDSIKNGIEKEIEAYEELINAKKDELSAEKDLYDFQKTIREQSKDIADIQRKLASISTAAAQGDLSALAQQKRLQAELVEAQAQLEDTYYNRSIDQQQQALDQELEDFQEEKNKEIEQWDLYMTQVEQVVADSLNVVQSNANGIAETLTSKANEYNLTVSDAILNPWQDGSIAVTDYQTKFDTAASSTWDQLDGIHNKWREIIEDMNEAANIDISNINSDNASYAPLKQSASSNPNQGSNNGDDHKNSGDSGNAKPTLKSGSYIEVKPNTKWYADSFGGGKWGYAKSGKILYVNEKGSHPYNIEGLGWVRKEDIVGYAKGTAGVKNNQFAWIDELGEELVMHTDGSGKLAFLSKGSAVIPHDISENLMELGQLDPSEILSRSAPQIGISPSVINNNTEIHIDASVGELIHVDHLDGNNLDEINKVVDKAWDKKMQTLNNSIRKFTR